MDDLQQWQGRSETLQDDITAAPLRGLSATLDRDDPPPRAGTELPPLAHWLYFLQDTPQRELGIDGRPTGSGILPNLPLPRRMWAGCAVQWLAPLRVGDAVQRVSRIHSLNRKVGRSGELVFVEVRHEISNDQGLAITSQEHMVYRPAPQPGDAPAAPTAAPTDAAWSREIVPTEALLFRYSALTFTASRQHFDRPYATGVDGHPGLMVHGPLLAVLMVDLARRRLPGAKFSSFSYKAVRPTFDLHPFRVHGRPSADGKTIDLWSSDHEGWLTMQATLTLA